MKVVLSVLTVVGALSASEASAVNWGVGLYVPVGIVDQFHLGTAWQRDGREHEPAPIVLAEARKAAKHGASGAAAFNGRWSVVISTRNGSCEQFSRHLPGALERIGDGFEHPHDV